MTKKPSIFQPAPTAVLRYHSLLALGGALFPLFGNHRFLSFVIIYSPAETVWYLMANDVWSTLNRPHPTDGIQPIWCGSLSSLLDLIHNLPIDLSLRWPDAPNP